ncbi:putative RNA recognition motif domain, nucleotide-binding alpha-beta plait domain superfamily [Helianthus debilis subsp. tardiflorus]
MSGRDRYQTDTWYDVPFKKGKGSRHQQHEKEKDQGVKFFVSNLPDRCASADLVKVLKGFGDIRGTYIARKLDRLGKRFGFVTFNRGRNMEDLEVALKDVWIGSYKLFIVPARFVDGKEIPRKEEKVWQPVKGKEVKEEGKEEVSGKESIPMDVCVDDRRSFKDTLLNKEPINSEVLEINVDPSLVVFGDWYDRAVIVHLKSLEALTNLRIWLKNMSINEVEIKYVGGLCAILVFLNRDFKMEFTSNKDAWGLHDDLLEEWNGQSFTVPKIAWLKIRGVPLSLSCAKVFEDVATKFGSIIQSATFPEEDGDLSVACVGILRSGSDRVNQKVILNWKSSKFEVWVEEEMVDWIPECLVEMEDEETVMEEVVGDANENSEAMMDLNVAHMDNSNNIGQEDDDLVGADSGVQVHIGEKTPVMKKRKGFCRKKGSRNKSASPVGNDRPKKRQREGEDLFDLDRFIYTVNVGQMALEKHNGSDPNGFINEEVTGGILCLRIIIKALILG